MARRVRFGVTLPQIKRSWEQARAAATSFDRLDFDSVWVCDHVYGVPFPTLPIFEAWTELAAVAAITDRVELGTLVSPPWFRHPAVWAKQIATLDHVSNGRTIVGLGAGLFDSEFTSYGLPFPPTGERLAALEDTIAIMKGLWTNEKTTYAGRHFSVHEAYCEPKPIRRPPILIAGGGEKVLMRLVAKHADIWNNPAVAQAELAKKVEVLRRRCDDVGRDPGEIEISQQCVVVIAADDAGARAALAKAEKLYAGHMGAGLAEHGIWGTPEQVVERIGRYVDLGCTLFVMEFFGKDTREPAWLFAERVLPAFR
jgi:alkanesulfonate monooxygenase SsuD/methylene tetrahydromethanopterin reductase-like flavin-dependent oxidoreductase (luciferase family)